MLCRGEYDLSSFLSPAAGDDPVLAALAGLGQKLQRNASLEQQLDKITARLNAGLLLDDILESMFHDLKELIPFNRLGLSLLEDGGATARARWARNDTSPLQIGRDYAAPMAGSSLQTILDTGEPRILNDLEEYLRRKPESQSTRLILAEGMRSSLTCPLVANGAPVGFLFFSSNRPYAYAGAHIAIFKRIAGQLSAIVEKGRLVSQLTDQKAAIERQNQELRHLNEVRNMLLGIAAHDIRNPVGYIQTVTDFLLASDGRLDSPEGRELLQGIGRQTRHALTLLSDVLDLTQIEAGKVNLVLEPVELCQFLTESIRIQTADAVRKEIRLELEVSPGPLVLADRVRLRQVLDNLISNAIKFSPGGSQVTVRAELLPEAWRISVADEGPGVSAEDHEHLFQPFSRLSARPTGGEKSTGLGLAIARRIVEAHRGSIGVEALPAGGACFWFTLPVADEKGMPG